MSQRDPLEGKRVGIIGFGRQGKALAQWLPNVADSVIVNDSRTAEQVKLDRLRFPGVEFVLGRHPENILDDVDVVCVSGGVPLSLPILQRAQANGSVLTNDAELFLERCLAPVVGITGSAGKTTTTKLVGEIIQNAGYKTWVGGNIGDVLLDNLSDINKDDRVVMELSSFQLELMRCSPQVAAILNITPNHLDRHETMENYVAAKANILKYQRSSDIAVLNYDNATTRSLEDAVAGEVVWFSGMELVPNGTFMAGDRILLAGAASYDFVPHVLLNRDEIPLRGNHNVYNVLAACAIVGALGLATDTPGIEPDVMVDTVKSFKPVPHRLEHVAEINSVTYINDSIATAPERLVAALHSFEEPLVLLIGGADKDLPWDAAIQLAIHKARHIVVFGAEGKKQVRTKVMPMFRMMRIYEDRVTCFDTLDEAVAQAAKVAEAGDVVLMSPGGTSYDAYPDFAARGVHFRELVAGLSS